MTPEGFTEAETLTRRFGSLTFATSENPPAFWIVAKGAISPSFIREELPFVARFGQGHPEGWDYIVDTTRVTLIHPYNPLLLRQVRSLPHNRRYIIVAPLAVRFLGRLVSWVIRPTHIVGSHHEALALIRGGVAEDIRKQ